MNNTSLKVADEMISCGNPRLLVALLKRAATEAKANFRTTEGELLHMFQCVDLVEEMEDTVKSLNKQLIQLVETSEPKQVEKAEEKVAKAASPKKKVMRRKRRSDMGKKREGAALENIRKAAKKNAVKRRLSKRLELAKKQVVEQNTVS